MFNNVLTQKTATTFSTAGTTLTLTDLANAAGRMSLKVDLGGKWQRGYTFVLKTKFASAATAGATVDLYWAPSIDNTVFPGLVTGADAAFPATVADNAKQLDYIGSHSCTNDTNAQYSKPLYYKPAARYGALVVINSSGQAMSGTAGDHSVTMTPVSDLAAEK